MADFFCKLLPPRPTFAQDMTEDERQLMQEHAGYWREGIQAGRAVAFGFVADPDGPFGLGIVRVDDEAAARSFTDEDPVIRARRGFEYRILPMPLGIATA